MKDKYSKYITLLEEVFSFCIQVTRKRVDQVIMYPADLQKLTHTPKAEH